MRIFRSILLTLAVAGSGHAAAQVDYARAEQFLSHRMNKLIYRADATPQWLPDGRFWYRTWTAAGWEFVRVDPERGTRTVMFDTGDIAAGLTRVAGGASFDAKRLTFTDFKLQDAQGRMTFQEGERRFSCALHGHQCEVIEPTKPQFPVIHTSPDGKWAAYIEDYNVFVRNLEHGRTVQLTSDGAELHGYGLAPLTGADRMAGERSAFYAEPVLAWSPDSRKIAVLRWDYRGVKTMPLYSSTTPRPRYVLYPEGLPGDEQVQRFDIHLLDLEARTNTRVDAPAQPMSNDAEWYMRAEQAGGKVWRGVKWSQDSSQLYFSHLARSHRQLSLRVADAHSGATRLLIDENTPEAVVSLKMRAHTEPVWRLSSEQDLLWFSWRDGWGHLYRYSPDGELKNQITHGDWSFSEVHHVDHSRGVMYFTARGMERGRVLNYTHGYRINLDGTGLQRLTPEDADHQLNYSPDGRYFVDRYSRDDLPPVTVLRSAQDGRVLLELERADISALQAAGWQAPTLFEAVADDGVSPIYGRIFRPSHFDPAKRYPIIDNIYPMPSGGVFTWGFSPGSFFEDMMEKQALAELGFIVVSLTGRGTAFRSKSFLDAYQGQIGMNTLPDHVAAIRQLAAQHRWIDIDRVGLYGLSGGGFATAAGLLRYPDFFKVGVSLNGNHDNRSYIYSWGEKFQGPFSRDTVTGKDNYEDQANYTLAAQLQGKLLLLVGDLDDNVHPAQTLRLVHALIAANKRFDFMLFPDRGHDLKEPYVVRMTWDYFVEHLLGVSPPEYVLSPFDS